MGRAALGIISGLVAWTVIVTLLDIGLRHVLPGYAAAERILIFTLAMKIARLVMAAVTSLVAGAVVRAIAPRSTGAPWITGLIILALFLPEHVRIWSSLPVWYHLSFLIPLAPLLALGAWTWSRVQGVAPNRAGGQAALLSETGPVDLKAPASFLRLSQKR